MQQTQILLPPNFSSGEPFMFDSFSMSRAKPLMVVPAVVQHPAHRWNQRCAMGLGIAMMVLSGAAFAGNIGWFFIPHNVLASVGVGFWAGGLVLVAGLLLTASGCRPMSGLIVAVLITSIVALVVNIATLVLGFVEIVSYVKGYAGFESSLHQGIGALFVIIGLIDLGLLLAASIMASTNLFGRGPRSPLPQRTALLLNQDGRIVLCPYPATGVTSTFG